MATGTIDKTIKLPGISLATRATRTASGQEGRDPTLPAGKAGTLTTRTDDDTGVATLSAGHQITDTDDVDVYWVVSNGGVRYGMDVTSVNGNEVSINAGAGDVLPAEDSAVVVTKRVEIDLDFDGDQLKMIAAYTDQRAHVEFLTSADVSIDAEELVSGEGFDWVYGQGVTNPFATKVVAKVQATCGVSTASTQLMLGVLFESV